MGLYKTKGIVLKSIKLGEADKIVTIFSGSRGKISAVAKGIRRTKSKFGSRLEPFTYAQLLLYEGRNLDIVTQAEITSSFKEIREDLDRFAFGSAMLDVVNKVSMEREKDEQLFELLLSTLEVLSQSFSHHRLLLLAFDLKLMSVSGYLPELDSCVVCEKQPQGEVNFSFKLGGILCPVCSSADASACPISLGDLKALRKLLKKPLSESVKLKVPNPEKTEKFLLGLVQNYLDYHLETKLKSREYLSKNH